MTTKINGIGNKNIIDQKPQRPSVYNFLKQLIQEYTIPMCFDLILTKIPCYSNQQFLNHQFWQLEFFYHYHRCNFLVIV